MFSPEDFEVPLEKKLKIRIVFDEIDKCTDVKALQENLKASVDQTMKYQHLLTVTLKRQIEADLLDFSKEIEKVISDKLDQTN